MIYQPLTLPQDIHITLALMLKTMPVIQKHSQKMIPGDVTLMIQLSLIHNQVMIPGEQQIKMIYMM